MTPADWSIVDRVPILCSMGETSPRSVAGHRIVRSYDRGERLFQQGASASRCFLMLEGWIELYREMTDGHEVVVSLFTVGQSFAEAMTFRGSRYPATAETVAPARLFASPTRRSLQSPSMAVRRAIWCAG